MAARDVNGNPLISGWNVDRIDVDKGMSEAEEIGFTEFKIRMVINYGLLRWARGEEEAAQKMMLEYGVDLTSIYRIVAAART